MIAFALSGLLIVLTSVVQGIVQEHGGRIDFASRPGAGTTVTVRVPLADIQPMV